MSSKRYPDGFRIEAFRQVGDRGHGVADVAGRPVLSLTLLLFKVMEGIGLHVCVKDTATV